VQFINEEGAVDAKVDHSIFYVIGVLEQAVSFFVWSLFYLIWHMYQAKKQLQKQMQLAQIQQLTNQLSPHFLFNTFNSIRALIYEDQDKAADTLTQLSELFRTHLQAHLRAVSNLQEEWQVGLRYLAIEQTRLEERLTVKVDIDEALYQQKLPTLTLLTLLENATKHGISPNIEPGFIELCAQKKDNDFWQLTLINSVGSDSKAQGTQTGLSNIEKRLSLMFTDQAHFHYEKTDKQFSVTLELPYA
jgi:LytS/YehU family sensor histidine kinase